MGRIAAIGGGDLMTTRRINQYIVEMSGKEKPAFLFIGTASRDDLDYTSRVCAAFEELGCAARELALTKRTCRDEEIDEELSRADTIYVGGGDTAFMMGVWRQYGLPEKLKRVYREDRAVLSGLSAGAMCWFDCGHSDSQVFWDGDTVGFGWVEGLLGIHHYALCPHYDERVESFDAMIGEKAVPGIALEEDTAFVENGGRVAFVTSDENAHAYVFELKDGRHEKREQRMQVL